eukprot:tig00000248_g21819.t1
MLAMDLYLLPFEDRLVNGLNVASVAINLFTVFCGLVFELQLSSISIASVTVFVAFANFCFFAGAAAVIFRAALISALKRFPVLERHLSKPRIYRFLRYSSIRISGPDGSGSAAASLEALRSAPLSPADERPAVVAMGTGPRPASREEKKAALQLQLAMPKPRNAGAPLVVPIEATVSPASNPKDTGGSCSAGSRSRPTSAGPREASGVGETRTYTLSDVDPDEQIEREAGRSPAPEHTPVHVLQVAAVASSRAAAAQSGAEIHRRHGSIPTLDLEEA